MKVLVTVDRAWQNWAAIWRELAKLPPDTRVIHGGCRGADRIAGHIAKALGMDVVAYPADWNTHGKAAGPIRNSMMLRHERPDLVLAFHPDLKHSRGTADCVRQALAQARKSGRPVVLEFAS